MLLSRVSFRTLPLTAALALAFASNVQAQSLVEMYEAARGYDAGFISAKAQFEADLSKANQALGGILPNIALTSSATRTFVDMRYDNPGAAPPNFVPSRFYGTYSAAITLTQPIYQPASWVVYKQGGRLLEQSAAKFQASEQELLVRVSQAYFDVLSSEDSLTLVQAQKKAVDEQLASAKRNFEVGTTTVIGVRDAQARFDLANAQEIAAENDLRIKRLALDMIVGMSHAKPKRLANQNQLVPPPKDGVETWVSQSENTNPNVRQAQLALEVATLEIDRAMAAHKPTVNAQINYAGTRNTSGTAATTTTTAITDTHVFAPSAALVLNVPLFAGFATHYRVKETVSLEDKARADFENIKRNTAQATRTAYYGLVAGLSQVKAYEAAEASSQSSLDANKLGYSVGVNINIDVLNAQSQLYQTKRDLAKARYDVLVSTLKLRQASGTLTPEDLQSINSLLAP